ncbi:serine carboxypeptidase [Rhizoctonia solani]|uniref:Carboxypeptidase n=1 Tax=Rhizoctonia solani TaxID=456999 RepID=A0A8H7M4D0_9AGAM|nr:serine carboxypeptidase [Rhizoctonia solani]
MMHSLVLVGLLSFLSGILANTVQQFPIINEVIGGIPLANHSSSKSKIRLEANGAIKDAIAPGTLRYIENSGICETTKGVYQASGYADLTARQSMWFWFFAARKNPDTALSRSGGPGSSSMIGLFQENGPCRMNEDELTVSHNPYSWNEYANMLYIDQPIGAGYSYGQEIVESSKVKANHELEELLIIGSVELGSRCCTMEYASNLLLDPKFSGYASRDFAIWTESYGGHYGPAVSAYFLSQNDAIDVGTVTGIKINLKVLSIGNGMTDPYAQYPEFITYALSNPYQRPLVSDSTITKANNSLYASPDGCLARIQRCNNQGSNTDCSLAQAICNGQVLDVLSGDYDVYDVRVKNPNPYPYNPTALLQNTTFMAQIGALSTWQAVSYDVYYNFAGNGDWMRSSSPDLEKVINAGVINCIPWTAIILLTPTIGSYFGLGRRCGLYLQLHGVEATITDKFTSEFQQQGWSNWTVSGYPAGVYKNAGTFSYLRVYDAGHEVPAYGTDKLEVGQAALEYFVQVMQGKSISST